MTHAQLTTATFSIRSKIDALKKAHMAEIAPLEKQIEEVVEKYLDSQLKDSNGDTVRVGDVVINKDGDGFKMLKRVCLHHSGRVYIEAERIHKTWHTSIFSPEINQYTIKK